MFTLTEMELKSSVWIKVVGYCEAEISLLRIRNDSALLTDKETNIIRGQIKALNELKNARIEKLVTSKSEIPGLIDDTPVY